jgi:hypothetical protein
MYLPCATHRIPAPRPFTTAEKNDIKYIKSFLKINNSDP